MSQKKRNRTQRLPNTWTVAIDSVPDYGGEAEARCVAEIVERTLGSHDPHVGFDRSGVVTVLLDMSAGSFEEAVRLAVQELTRAVSSAGREFAVDYDRLPEPVTRGGH